MSPFQHIVYLSDALRGKLPWFGRCDNGRSHFPVEVDWAGIRVGDNLVPQSDIAVKSHRKWYKRYPSHRQFTAGKEYEVVQVRSRTGVIFLIDDAGFRVNLNQWQGRRFVVERS